MLSRLFISSGPILLAEESAAGTADWVTTALFVALALFLVALNGFFVAAEFALVKVRLGQIEKMVDKKRPFSKTARWLAVRLDESLSACQLGITMASLALGWVGEPAFVILVEPVFRAIGIASPQLVHGMAFVVSFIFITALHLVIGEQAPKIFAIRRPEPMVLWCAAPLKFFYVILYPLLIALNLATSFILARLGLTGSSEHSVAHSEEEIRSLLREAHVQGNLTRSEHRLLNAVFEFDDMICRRVMVPRGDVVFFDVASPFSESLEIARTTRHTRYPLCDGSLDKVLGVIHLKDLIGFASSDESVDLKTFMRPPHKVPENMPISQLLRHFQKTHQLLAFVVDEYATIIGIVTLENVLEKIVGPVDDEFDVEEPVAIKATGPGRYVVVGTTLIEDVERALQLELDEQDVDTVAGVLMTRSQKLPAVDDCIEFDGATAQILEVRDDRATLIQFTLNGDDGAAEEVPVPTKPDSPSK